MANDRTKNKLGQYFTPSAICEFMVALTSKNLDASVLEPSSGKGAFLDALNAQGFKNVTGVEIDPEIANHSVYEIHNSSFISWQSEDRFDLVIGNPPYIRWKDLAAEQKNELKGHRLFGSIVNSLSDYLLPFIALSIEKLNPEGELIFITPSFWLQTKHSSSLRDYLSSHGQVTDLVDFGEARIFKDVATSLIVFKFVKTPEARVTRLHRFIGDRVSLEKLELSNPNLFRSEVISSFQSKGKFVPAFDDEVRAPLALESECMVGEVSNRLGDFVRIANGMVTGLDEAFRLSDDFVVKLNKHEMRGVARVIKGKNLQNLYSPGYSYYIDIDPTLDYKEVVMQFPSLLAALEPWKDKLLERYDYGGRLNWWQWSFYRSEKFHRAENRKGFVPGKERLSHKPYVRFSLASPGVIATQDVTAFAPKPETRESIDYIVAYLNLPVVSAWVRVFGLMKGGVAEFSEKPLSEIPFRSIDWNNPGEVAAHGRINDLMADLATQEISPQTASKDLEIEFEKLMPGLLRLQPIF